MDSTTSRPAAGLFINANYFRLWLGQAISIFGDFVFDITLVLWIATSIAAGKSWAPVAVSGVLFAATVPGVVFGPLAGVFVDRWDKRRTMLAMDLTRAGLIAVLLVVAETVPHVLGGSAARTIQLVAIYAVVFATSLCSQFFNPSRLTLIGDVVHPDVRSRASGLGQTTMHVAAVIGPSLAGPLYFRFGAPTALLVNALSFLLSFVAIVMVKAPRVAPSVQHHRPDVLRELGEGLKFFGRNRVLTTVLASTVLVMFGAGALNALDVFFVTSNLHAPASAYGFLDAALGIGAVVGAIAASTVGARWAPTRVFSVGMMLTSLGLVVYSRLDSFPVAFVVLFLTGMPMAALNVALMPIILGSTPREMLGRVSSVLNPTVNAATLGSIVIAGWLAGTVMTRFHAELFGVSFGRIDTIFLASGVLGLLAGTVALLGLHDGTGETAARRKGARSSGRTGAGTSIAS